jgi:1,2-phenylacetyl-CoA epoxidase catalytic subunit
VTAKIILETKRNAKTEKSEIKKWDIGELNIKEVQEKFIKKVTANVQNTQLEEVEDINEKGTK